MSHPLTIEDRQNLVPLAVFVRQSRGGRRLLKLIALSLVAGIAMLDVVCGAPVRIAEDLVSIRNHAEGFGVARLLIIRVKALSLNAIDAMDGLLIGVRPDLKRLVIVDEHVPSV